VYSKHTHIRIHTQPLELLSSVAKSVSERRRMAPLDPTVLQVSVCMYGIVNVCVRLCVFVCMCVCVSLRVYVHAYMYMHVKLLAVVCLCTWTPFLSTK